MGVGNQMVRTWCQQMKDRSKTSSDMPVGFPLKRYLFSSSTAILKTARRNTSRAMRTEIGFLVRPNRKWKGWISLGRPPQFFHLSFIMWLGAPCVARLSTSKTNVSMLGRKKGTRAQQNKINTKTIRDKIQWCLDSFFHVVSGPKPPTDIGRKTLRLLLTIVLPGIEIGSGHKLVSYRNFVFDCLSFRSHQLKVEKRIEVRPQETSHNFFLKAATRLKRDSALSKEFPFVPSIRTGLLISDWTWFSSKSFRFTRRKIRLSLLQRIGYKIDQDLNKATKRLKKSTQDWIDPPSMNEQVFFPPSDSRRIESRSIFCWFRLFVVVCVCARFIAINWAPT